MGRAVSDDPELDRLQREVMDRFKARPFTSWNKPLLRAILVLFDIAGIVSVEPSPELGRRRLTVVR